jgi:hypothetical protein
VVSLLVLSDHGERVEDVLGLISGEPVDVEHGGVEIGPQERTAIHVPPEGRTVVTHLLGVRLKPPRGIRQL